MKNSRLKLLGLPIIENIDDLSNYTNLSKNIIYQFSRNSASFYKEYNIPKKSGGNRTIFQPSKDLKGLQSWILINILNKLKSSEAAKGFEKGISLNDNVIPHRNSNVILNIDLKDFFYTIKSKQVYNIFNSIGYNETVSTIFTNLCTYKNCLPQGGPCSPKLANLACWNLDIRIQGFVGRRGIIYTRYADDMTFSGIIPQRVINILPILRNIINNENFEINERKTRFVGLSRKREITGLILYKETYGIGREKYRELRPKIYLLTKFNKDDSLHEKEINHLLGWISYIRSVDRKRYSIIKKYINNLAQQFPEKLIIKLHLNIKNKK